MEITPHAAEADVLVVNTCAFIDVGEGGIDRGDPGSARATRPDEAGRIKS